jgi:hypothetical protein
VPATTAAAATAVPSLARSTSGGDGGGAARAQGLAEGQRLRQQPLARAPSPLGGERRVARLRALVRGELGQPARCGASRRHGASRGVRGRGGATRTRARRCRRTQTARAAADAAAAAGQRQRRQRRWLRGGNDGGCAALRARARTTCDACA